MTVCTGLRGDGRIAAPKHLPTNYKLKEKKKGEERIVLGV